MLYSSTHGNEAHDLYRREVAFFSAWRDEEDLNPRELMRDEGAGPIHPNFA